MNRRNKVSQKQAKLSDKQLCDTAKQKPGVIDARIISPSDVETGAWVRLKCQFGCGCYGQCLVCPPFTPPPEQMRKVLDAYDRAVLIHFEPEAKIKATIADLEREIFLCSTGRPLALVQVPAISAKTVPSRKNNVDIRNRHSPAMEACGIDVFSTVRKAGFPIEVVSTTRQCPNYYGLVLVD